jgi:hypothetical protein
MGWLAIVTPGESPQPGGYQIMEASSEWEWKRGNVASTPVHSVLICSFILIAKNVNSNASGKSQSNWNSLALDLGSLLIAPDCTSVQMAS